MANVVPFRALRPRDDLAGDVIAPPYDVLDEEEARALTTPRSFLRITRAEVDLPAGTDAHADPAYQTARANLDAFVRDGILVEDDAPTFYLYGQAMGEHHQVGVLAGASVAEYDDGRIARHELTRPDKEDDRTRHMDVLDAQVGLVFLAHRPNPALAAIVSEITSGAPAWSVRTADGVDHRLWPVPADRVAAIQAAFVSIDRLYVADGHHRSAAASRIHAARGDAPSAYFLAGVFPSDQLLVMAYNRVVHDLNGLDEATLRSRLADRFEVSDAGVDTPAQRGDVSMYLGGRWSTLRVRERPADPVGALDVSILQEQVLSPLLGIDDPRRSDRISFVGGIRGVQALVDAVDRRPGSVAFHLFPTSLDELFAVADAGQMMPPKSTWFEPKLREGVVIRRLS